MMSAKVILLLCVLVCHQGGTQSQENEYRAACVHNDVIYNEWDIFEVGKCIIGYCNSDGQVGTIRTCCIYGDTTYENNSSFMITPCLTGHCRNGEIVEEETDCPDPVCSDTFHVEGECCDRCPEGYVLLQPVSS